MAKSTNKTLFWLSLLVALLAMTAATNGLFWLDNGQPFVFTTLHGHEVEIAGQGLYRNEIAFKAPILRGGDAVTLFIAIPVLLFAALYQRKVTLKGQLLLAGVLSYFLYNAASLAFGAAYNPMFLVYLAWFSASLFAFIIACSEIDLDLLTARINPKLPHRGTAIFMFLAGLSVFVWMIEIVNGLVTGQIPESLASYTTDVTALIDVGVIVPSAFLAGISLLRKKPIGYLLAPILLILNAFIGIVVVSQSIFQARAGIILSTGQFAAYVTPFVLMSFIAVFLVVMFFKNIEVTNSH
jgi:hypothetical protein